jgi:hypothetical protein
MTIYTAKDLIEIARKKQQSRQQSPAREVTLPTHIVTPDLALTTAASR